MAEKLVRYTGDTMTAYSCSSPDKLVAGNDYKVILTRDKGYQTNYILDGVDGEFNANWFEDVSCDEKTIYLGYANDIPKIGERYLCTRMEFVCGRLNLVVCSTSEVENFDYLGNNVYQITTLNSIYVIKVN